MSTTIQRLFVRDRAIITSHLLRLSADDRHTRFFSAVSDVGINGYVSRINFESDVIFGAVTPENVVVGMVHLGTITTKDGKRQVEMGFSVDADARGKGIAKLLMAQALIYCQNHGVEKLCMSCLRDNMQMRAVARSFNLDMTIDFDAAYAELTIHPCVEECQYAKDVGMIGHRCATGCIYNQREGNKNGT